MATEFAVNYMTDITAEENTPMEDAPLKSSGRVNISYSEHGKVMQYSLGGNSLMAADNTESTVRSSETNRDIGHQTLSDKLTPLLIARGLVRGIIPMSMRGRFGQITLDVVLRPQDGENAEKPKGVL